MENLSEKYYDEAWGQWDDMKSFGPASRHVRRIIMRMIQGLEFSTVLDAGCGVGTLIAALMQRYPQVQYTGTDISREGIERGKQKVGSANFQVLNLEKESLKKTFDLVLCIDVIEHIENDVKAIQQLKQMTKKHLLLVVPTGPLFEQERISVGHVHGFSVKEVEEKLQHAGFSITKKISWGFPFYNLYRRLVMRLPASTVSGKYGFKKRVISEAIYLLLFFNLPVGGERLFVLCETNNEDK